jgi:hypothetical protein
LLVAICIRFRVSAARPLAKWPREGWGNPSLDRAERLSHPSKAARRSPDFIEQQSWHEPRVHLTASRVGCFSARDAAETAAEINSAGRSLEDQHSTYLFEILPTAFAPSSLLPQRPRGCQISGAVTNQVITDAAVVLPSGRAIYIRYSPAHLPCQFWMHPDNFLRMRRTIVGGIRGEFCVPITCQQLAQFAD